MPITQREAIEKAAYAAARKTADLEAQDEAANLARPVQQAIKRARQEWREKIQREFAVGEQSLIVDVIGELLEEAEKRSNVIRELVSLAHTEGGLRGVIAEIDLAQFYLNAAKDTKAIETAAVFAENRVALENFAQKQREGSSCKPQ